MRVDLNADAGESFGAFTMGDDAALMASVTSTSLAAGFHAGDPSVLRRSLVLAKGNRVAVGAHPGLPDLNGFGRRELHVTPDEAEDLVLYQVAAVAGVAAAEGIRLQHVKPHGALYSMAMRSPHIARAIVKAVLAFNPSLILFAPPRSELFVIGESSGLRVAAEVFADRTYENDGSLTPRSTAGALVTDANVALERVLHMLETHTVVTRNGAALDMRVDTVCIHSDTPGAGKIAFALRKGLEARGVTVAPLLSNGSSPEGA
jgi:UPF0271 protein